MGSRLRENPSHLIECWCEVVAPQGSDHPPWIIQKFPRAYNEVEVLKNIPQFTFPCSFQKPTVQHFSFVLTNLESKFLYGFCRHAPGTETGLVVLSHLPWHKLFYNLLNYCANLISHEIEGDLWTFLQAVYQYPVPAPGTRCEIAYSENKFFICEAPNHLALPSIPEDRNLNEYFNAVDIDNMITIFASMLNERRIIVTSERVSRLSSSVQAANSLIYPMSWQHIFIPVLPEDLLDYLSAPMPFLIGVAWSLMQKVRIDDIGEVIILNADTNKIQTPFSDVSNLPEEVVYSLRKNLKPPNILIGDQVARAFLKAIVHLIGNYRESLQFNEDDRRISLNEEKFVSNRPSHFQPFVENMLDLQIFRQFIEERLQLLNSGLHTSDEFELEASVYGEKVPSNMKQILTNVKKESGAIMKKVKNKTNPAVKSAVKSVTKGGRNVREKGKITYKDIRGKLKNIQQPHPKADSLAVSPYVNGEYPNKPRSAPSSPTVSRRSQSSHYGDYSARVTYKRASQGSPNKQFANGEIKTRGDKMILGGMTSADSNKTPSPQEIDLIGELEEALNTQLGSSPSSLPSHNQESSSSIGSQMYTETTSTFSIDSNASSFALDLSSSMSSALPDHSSPSTPIVENNLNVFNPKNGNTQDLLFFEAPQDEVFDPLLSKELIPPSTSLVQKLQQDRRSQKNSQLTGSQPLFPPPTHGSGNILTKPPRALSPSRYLPFSSLQQQDPFKPSQAYQNPLYNSHTPSSSVRTSYANAPAFSGEAAFRSFPPKQAESNAPTNATPPPQPAAAAPPAVAYAGRVGGYTAPCGNNAAAAFASTLISKGAAPQPKPPPTARTSYVNFNPPNSGMGRDVSQRREGSHSSFASQPCISSEDQLLGDFSQDFKKLSIAK